MHLCVSVSVAVCTQLFVSLSVSVAVAVCTQLFVSLSVSVAVCTQLFVSLSVCMPAGDDATSSFGNVGHSTKARTLRDTFLIGTVKVQ